MARRPSTQASDPVVLDDSAWLAAVADPSSKVAFGVCRYHHKHGMWTNPRWSMRDHFVTLIEQGCLVAEIDDQVIELHSGDMLWIPAATPNLIRGDPSQPDLRHINLRFSVHAGVAPVVFAQRYRLFRRAASLRPLLDELLAYHGDPGAHAAVRLRGLLLAVATAAFALEGSLADGPGLDAQQRRRVQQLVAERVGDGLDPAGLADGLGLSLDYFTRRFRHSYGVPPRRFLIEERMRLAGIQLCESDQAVAAIGRGLGLDDPNLFSRQFRLVMGCSPSAWRHRHQAPEFDQRDDRP
ncbi:MAG: helix-turn-helix domain-containing protein [Planctomycetota bacterium]|jgi:AraC-like DNA-binding protein|nr:helix-turn-helix domain-containing protein [Planctomycetota bacterium]